MISAFLSARANRLRTRLPVCQPLAFNQLNSPLR